MRSSCGAPDVVAAPEAGDPRGLDAAVAWLRSGGIVVFPTDTFYGLAADPTNPAAVARVFAVKGRSGGQALPLIAAAVSNVVAAPFLSTAVRSVGGQQVKHIESP